MGDVPGVWDDVDASWELDPEALLEHYLERIETSEDTGERIELLRQTAALLAERLHDPGQAYDALETAFELDPCDERTVRELEQMARATRRWPELVQLANGWLDRAHDRGTQLALCRCLAKWYASDLGREEYAEPYYLRILALDPADVTAARKLARSSSEWRERGRILEAALAMAANDSDRAAILTDLGEVYERHVDEDRALAHYLRARELAPSYLPVLRGLERIYDARDMLVPLVEVLRAEAACTSSREAAAINLRVGLLLEDTPERVGDAIDAFRDVLAVQPDNVTAIQGLVRCYTHKHCWPELRAVLHMLLDCAQSERERASVLVDIACLEDEQFLETARAAQRLERALEIDPHSERAYLELARVYRRLRQWRALVGCLERHITVVEGRAQTIAIQMQIAEIHERELCDQERAIVAYARIVDLDADHLEAHEALARLYEEVGSAKTSVAYLGRVIELTPKRSQHIAALHHMGRVLGQQLGERDAAREYLEQALDLDPTDVPTLVALSAIAVDDQDWERAVRLLEQQQEHTTAPRRRARVLVELGRLHAEKLDQLAAAKDAYERAHVCDRDNEEAAWLLARCYVEEGSWEEAEPLTEMLMRKAKKRKHGERLALSLLHGRVEGAVGKSAAALYAFETARELDATNREAIRGLAGASFACGNWDRAQKSYLEVLASLQEHDVERADIHYRLGCIEREQGRELEAVHHFDHALAIDPCHRATLQAMIAIHERMGEFRLTCQYRQTLLEGVGDPDLRYTSLTELGDIWAKRVGDSERALHSYERALDLKPDDHRLMHRMLEIYQETERWAEVVAILGRIVVGDDDSLRRSRYLFTMAQVCRDKLDDPHRAAELFDGALDADPNRIEAFQAIDRIYTRLMDWPRLERAYRKMIHRVHGQGKTELEYNLWHALGLIYRDRLHDNARALSAFGAAPRVNPAATEDYLILAELATSMDRPMEALAHYRALLEHDPMSVAAYRALHRIFLARHELDEAWCAAAVLSFLNLATEDEQRFFDERRRSGIPEVRECLDEESWVQHLLHPEEDRFIGKIFEAVALPALRAHIAALGAKKQLPVLPEAFLQDRQTSTVSFARTMWWAADVLGVQAPHVYARSDVPGGVAVAAAEPLASVAGQDVLTRLGSVDRAYVAGKHLAMYRGEHYLKALFPTVSELTVVFFSAIRLVHPELPAPAEYAREVELTARALAKHLTPIAREYLKVVVRAFAREGARANIKRWAQTVETTAARAGLLLSGDLEAAWCAIASEPRLPGDIRPEQRIKELLVYSVSEDYFALRRQLGIHAHADGAEDSGVRQRSIDLYDSMSVVI